MLMGVSHEPKNSVLWESKYPIETGVPTSPHLSHQIQNSILHKLVLLGTSGADL